MVTIARLTEELVAEKPFLQEALYRKIINYQALAEELNPEIEKVLKKKVKASTVMISLRRYAEKLQKNYVKKIVFGPECQLSMESNVLEISLKQSKTLYSLMQEIIRIIDFQDGGMLHFTNGTYDSSVVSNERYKDRLLKILSDESILEVNEGLVALSFRYSKEFRRIPGTLHQMLRVLAWENINIIQLIETMTETIFILSEDDSLRAFKVLQKLIKS